jgi:hypothetical protein
MGRSGRLRRRLIWISVLLPAALVVDWIVQAHFADTIQPPKLAMPHPNAYDAFVRAAASLKPMSGDANVDLRANRSALAAFHAAIGKPCQFPLTRYGNWSFNIDRQLALIKLVIAEGQSCAADGERRRAADCYLDVIEQGDMAARNSDVRGEILSMFDYTYATRPMDDLLDRCDERTARHTAERLGTLIHGMTPDYRALAFESVHQRLFLQDWSKGRVGSSIYDWWVVWPPVASSPAQGMKETCWRLYFQINRAAVLRSIDEGWRRDAEWLKRPVYARGPAPAPPSDPFVRNMVGDDHSIDMSCNLGLANLKVLAAKAALRAYRLRHGRYPATLADLRLDPSLTSDPFRDGPLFYRRGDSPDCDSKGYNLWSVGVHGNNARGRDPYGSSISEHVRRP